jgi:GWxTD domain-containing protein
MSTPYSRTMRVAILSVLGAVGLACSGRRPEGAPAPRAAGETEAPRRGSTPVQTDAVQLYRQMGLLAEGGETPFVGSVAYVAGPTADSTLMLLTLSLSTRALTFAREGDRYRAAYSVTLDMRQGGQVARRLDAREFVRVTTFKETTRTDESVIFQQVLPIAPGTYDMSLSVRDDGGNKSSAIEATVGVPRLGIGTVSSPIPFYEAALRNSTDSLPRIVPSPRSTVTFGQDSLVPVYVEGYGGSDSLLPLRAAVRGEAGSGVLWSDSVALPRRGSLYSGVVQVPVSRLGVGVATLAVWRSGGTDTTRTPLFVSFGDELPVASFAEMVNYLRYFAAPYRLQTLRDATAEQRASAWATFLRETDPIPATPQHEGLRDYFSRIAQANARFREEGSVGWLSDRGRVYVSLGSPDQIIEPNANDLNARGRAQIWDYRRHRLQVVFIDQTGFGRWRMTMGSETEFETVLRREQAR